MKVKELQALRIDLNLPKGCWIVNFIGEHVIKKDRNNALYVTLFLKPHENTNSELDILKREVRQNLLCLLREGSVIKEDYSIVSPTNNDDSDRFSFVSLFTRYLHYNDSNVLKAFYSKVSQNTSQFQGKFFQYGNYIVPCHVLSSYFFFCSTTVVDILFDNDFDNIIHTVNKTGGNEPGKGYVMYDNNKLNKLEAQRIGIFFFEKSETGKKALEYLSGFRNIFANSAASKTFFGIVPFPPKMKFEAVGKIFHFEGKVYYIVQQITKHTFLNSHQPYSIKTLETIPLHPRESLDEEKDKDVKGFTKILPNGDFQNATIRIANEGVTSGPTENFTVIMPGFVSAGITYSANKRVDQFNRYKPTKEKIIPTKKNKTTDDNFGDKGSGDGSQKIKVSIIAAMRRPIYIKRSIRWACESLSLKYAILPHSNKVYIVEIEHNARYVYVLEKSLGNTRIVGDAGFARLNEQAIIDLTYRFSKANERPNYIVREFLALGIKSIKLHASIIHQELIVNTNDSYSVKNLEEETIVKAGLKFKSYLKDIFSI